VKQRHFIDSHKLVTGVAILLMMAWRGAWDLYTAWMYLALHGSYGVLWFVKSRIFPDKTWERKTSVRYGLVIWAALSLYWVAPWILIQRGREAPPWLLGVCAAMCLLGVFLHFTTDMQKHTALKLQPERLITDGMLARSRNMNYFGELLIYLSFALLSMHWLPLAVLGAFIGVVWIPNMLRKDRSLSRYGGFETYKKRSKFFIPFIL
jgi:protein-S-isoprenylcysteine O-methyltransferase Ste14